MDSILKSVRKSCGLTIDDDSFDVDLIMHTNAVLMILNRIGVGSSDGFSIEGTDEEWTDFISVEHLKRLGAIKSYVGQKVRLIFDPPSSSTHLEALKSSIAEFEWTLNITAEMLESDGEEV